MSQGDYSIKSHFAELPDPRYRWNVPHMLIDIVTIAICGAICGADDWEGIAEFGQAKAEWFETFLELRNGVPSADTFRRVFEALDPEAFQSSFISWVQAINKAVLGGVLAIDGKRLRRSHDGSLGKSAIHMVSAWACEAGLVLGQVKTEEKSNEITAIPELLQALAIEGCIVTIDAMGCQTEIAKLIVEKEADYVLSLKGNQGTLHQAVQDLFEYAFETEFRDLKHDYHQTLDNGHGRQEIRRCWTIFEPDFMTFINPNNKWLGLQSIGLVEAERHLNGTVTSQKRFFISSLDGQAEQFASAVRHHWHIENRLHWVLDIAFREDEARIRKGFGAQNMAILRHIALNLLRLDQSKKCGIKNKRLIAGWDHNFLLHLLNLS